MPKDQPTKEDIYNPGTGWRLVWSDEFNGTTINPNNWSKHPHVRGEHRSTPV